MAWISLPAHAVDQFAVSLTSGHHEVARLEEERAALRDALLRAEGDRIIREARDRAATDEERALLDEVIATRARNATGRGEP